MLSGAPSFTVRWRLVPRSALLTVPQPTRSGGTTTARLAARAPTLPSTLASRTNVLRPIAAPAAAHTDAEAFRDLSGDLGASSSHERIDSGRLSDSFGDIVDLLPQ